MMTRNAVQKAIVKATGEALFQLLVANSNGVVKSFESDWDVDRRMIAKRPGEPFIHVARELGTYIFFAPLNLKETPDAEEPFLFGRLSPRRQLEQVIKMVADDTTTFPAIDKVVLQHFDGSRVRRLKSYGAAQDILRSWRVK